MALTVIESLARSLESVKPVLYPDRGFIVPRGGIAESLESWIRDADARQLREAVIRYTTLPSYGSSLCYLSSVITIEVAYPCSLPEDIREEMLMSDANAIVRQVTMRTSLWGQAESVYPTQGAFVEALSDDSDRDILFVLSIPFNVILSASGADR